MKSVIINSISAQLGYTVPFTLVHAGKYRTENKVKIQTIQKLQHKLEKANNTKQQNKTSVV